MKIQELKSEKQKRTAGGFNRPKMSIEDLINKSEAEVRDCMNGLYKILRKMPCRPNGQWMPIIIKHCSICSEVWAVHAVGNDCYAVAECSIDCHHIRTNSDLQPIEYNGKVYTIDDCTDFEKKKYNDPIRQLVQRLGYKRKDSMNRKLYMRDWSQKERKKNPALSRIQNASKVMVTILSGGKSKTETLKKYNVPIEESAKHIKRLAKLIAKRNKLTLGEVYKTHHIDHIIPKKMYDLSDAKEFLKCVDHRNLRLLPAKENMSRGCKVRPQDLEVIKTLPENIYPKGLINELL